MALNLGGAVPNAFQPGIPPQALHRQFLHQASESELREPINRVLLEILYERKWEQVRARYLGN